MTVEIVGLLDLIYGAALDSSLWVTVLERMADRVGAESGNLTRLHLENGTGSGVVARLDPSVMDAYFDHYAANNPLLKVDSTQSYIASWSPRVLTDEDWMPREAFVRSEYLNDFMRPLRAEWLMMIRLSLDGAELSSLALGRREGRGRFSDEERFVADRLQPHLIRAFELGQRLAVASGQATTLAQALDQAPGAAFVLDETGRLRHANRAGEALLRDVRGLTIASDRLAATDLAASQVFARLLRAAATASVADRRGGTLTLPPVDRRAPLTLTVAPVRPEPSPLFVSEPTVLVSVSDPEAGAAPTPQSLLTAYGLTPAESRVALAVLEGLNLVEIADRGGVSLNTVRAQLASAFGKTGARRQSELVRLLSRPIVRS